MANKKTDLEKTLDNKLEALKADPCKITAEAVADLWEPAREAKAEANTAMAAYEQDVATRKAELDKLAAELDEQIKTLKTEVSTLEGQSREAASRGDLDAAAEADEKAEALQKQLATATRKRRILSSTELKGDTTLFKRVQVAKKAFESTVEVSRGYVREAVSLIEAWSKYFSDLQKATKWETTRSPSFDGSTYDRINHHFNAAFYAEQARKKKEQEEAEKSRNSRYVLHMG